MHCYLRLPVAAVSLAAITRPIRPMRHQRTKFQQIEQFTTELLRTTSHLGASAILDLT